MGADLNVGELHRAKGRKRRLSLKDMLESGRYHSGNGQRMSPIEFFFPAVHTFFGEQR